MAKQMGLEDLLERARYVGQVAQQRAEEAEAKGQIAEEVIGALLDSELLKVLKPKLFGGFELDPWTYVEVVREVARHDMSAGWLYSVLEIHEWWLAYAHPGAQEEIWGNGQVITVDSVAPVGRAERVGDKWRVEGTWHFVSGVNWASWCAVNALAQFEEGAPLEPAFFILPSSDYKVERTWDVVGLAGTASNTVRVEGALVPEHRVLRLMPIAKGGVPLNPALRDSALYRTQFIPMLATAIYAPILGGAQRMVALYEDWLKRRVRPYALGSAERENPGAQRLLAWAKVHFDALHASQQGPHRSYFPPGPGKAQCRRAPSEGPPFCPAGLHGQRCGGAREPPLQRLRRQCPLPPKLHPALLARRERGCTTCGLGLRGRSLQPGAGAGGVKRPSPTVMAPGPGASQAPTSPFPLFFRTGMQLNNQKAELPRVDLWGFRC